MADASQKKYAPVAPTEKSVAEAAPVSAMTGMKMDAKLGSAIFENNIDVELVEGKSAEDKAGFFGRWFYTYLDAIFKVGNERTLMMADLGAVSERDRCAWVESRFDIYWAQEMKLPRRKQSLWRVLWRTVGWDQLFLSLWYYAIYAGVTYGPILIMNALVQDIQGTAPLSTVTTWIFVALMFVLPMLGSITAAMSNAMLAHVSVQFRNVLVTKVRRDLFETVG